MADELNRGMAALQVGRVPDGSHGSSEGSNMLLPKRKKDELHHFVQIMTRPGRATVCTTKVMVRTNFKELRLPSTIIVNQYNIECFKLNSKTKTWDQLVKREVVSKYFWACVDKNRNVFPDKDQIIYNDVNIAYSKVPFKLGNSGSRDFDIDPRDADPLLRGRGNNTQNIRKESIKLKIIVVPREEADLSQLNLKSKTFVQQFFDLVLTQQARCPMMPRFGDFVTKGNALFKIPKPQDRIRAQEIGSGQEVWMGLHGAIKPGLEGGILLNLDTVNTVYYKRCMNLVQFYSEIQTGYRGVPSDADLSTMCIAPQNCFKLQSILKGTRVEIRVPGQQTRYKKLEGVTTRPASHEYFTLVEEGREYRTSVDEFFYRKHNVKLHAPHLPCIEFAAPKNIGGGNSTKYPMEFVYTTEEPMRHKGRVDDHTLAAMVKASTKKPDMRIGAIEYMSNRNNDYLREDNQFLRNYDVEVSSKFIDVEAKRLPHPRLIQANTKEGPPTMPSVAGGSHEIFLNNNSPIPALEAPNTKFVPFFVFVNEAHTTWSKAQTDGNIQLSTNAVATLCLYGLSMTAKDIQFESAPNLFNKKDINSNSLERIMHKAKALCREQQEKQNHPFHPVLFFIFPLRHNALYSAIKYYGDSVHGVTTQCILAKVFKNFGGNPVTNNTLTNVMLKVVAKCGGIHFKMDRASHKNWAAVTNPDEPTLFLSIDVSHPGAEERAEHKKRNDIERKKRAGPGGRVMPQPRASEYENYSFVDCPRSVFAIVGNIDVDAVRYDFDARVQRLGQEQTVHFVDQVKNRISAFIENTGKKPKHIVVYRDGVSDTEFKKVIHEELESIRQACTAFDINLKTMPDVVPGEAPESNLDEVGPPNSATFTYIVTQKRHHARFFVLEDGEKKIKDTNLLPGTIIEDIVVSNDFFDFYIASHEGTTGTSRPTHYYVLQNTWKVSTSFWQSVIYCHCYLYARTTKSISLPAPLMYAHLAAKKCKLQFDYFRTCPPQEYITSTDDIVRMDMEQKAVTNHEGLIKMRSMTFC